MNYAFLGLEDLNNDLNPEIILNNKKRITNKIGEHG